MSVSRIGGILALAAAGYGGLSVFFAHLFTNLRANPGIRVIDASPADEGLPFEDVAFPADVDGLTISGWLIPQKGSTRALILVPGGGCNRISMAERPADHLMLVRALWERGHTVLVYDPRGTGRSQGRRISFGFLEARDLVGALRFLAERGYPAQRVGVLGWSMGAATAMFALARVTYGCLVVDSPLGGVPQEVIVRNVAPALGLPLSLTQMGIRVMVFGVFTAARLLWGMRLGAHAVHVLREHPVPTLVIHGKADSQVPVSVGQEVAQAAGDALMAAHFLEGVDHVGAYASDPAWYTDTVCHAFDEVLK